MVKKDILRTYDLIQGNTIKKIIGCFRSPGVHAIVIFRFGKWLKRKNILFRVLLEPIYLYLFYRVKSRWGIEISRTAEIDEGFYIGHFGGIVIHGDAIIGKDANISQQITIGLSGQGSKAGVPMIGNNVYIAPGAKLFGKIKIGNNVKIGANAVVYKDIPDNAIVVLEPGFKVISLKGNHPCGLNSRYIKGVNK